MPSGASGAPPDASHGQAYVERSLSAKGLLVQEKDVDEHRVREWLAGNLCRCTGYDKIVRAVLDVSEKMKQAG